MLSKLVLKTINYALFFSLLMTMPMAMAQSDESLGSSIRRQPIGEEEGYQLEALPLRSTGFDAPSVGSPTITIGNPSAYGASWGQIGFGVGYQARTRFTSNDDGAFGFAFGIGDPYEVVGLQMGILLADLSDTFDAGGLSFKLHRALPEDFRIAVGVQGVANWGDTDAGTSAYGVITKRIALKPSVKEPLSELYLSLGVGSGRFRSEDDIFDDRDSVGVFASGALKIIEQINFVTEWTGQDMIVGFSLVPFKNIGLVITPAAADITDTAGDGARFILGVSYSHTF